MKRLLCLSVLLCFFWITNAQNGVPPIGGARAAGMGYTGLTFTDVNALFTNQAGIADLDGVTATAFGEQRFLLSELGNYSFGLAVPTASGTFGLTLNYFGFEGYNEQRLGLAYGRRLFEKISIGAQALVLNTQIPEYGSKAVVTFELGVLVELLPQLSLGVHTYSPVRVNVVGEEYLPSVLKAVVQYSPSKQIVLLAEVEKDIDYPARAKFGVEYQVAEPFHLRLGVATQPTSVNFGFGYQLLENMRFDIATAYHELLGFSPAGGLVYHF
jgi:hypothetical protein